MGTGVWGCHFRAVTASLAVFLGSPSLPPPPSPSLGEASQGLHLLGMCLGVKDTGHGVSQGCGGTGRARGASAAPSLPATPLAGQTRMSPLPCLFASCPLLPAQPMLVQLHTVPL